MSKFNTFIIEGGAYGHLSHPYDIDNFTFNDLKEIIVNALSGKLDYAEEKCLDGNTTVIVDGNSVAIKEVVDGGIGEYILSYNPETNTFENSLIMGRHNNGETDEWIIIETEDNKTLKLTPSHRVLTSDGFKMAIELTEDDDIICL